jgi:hypothetical protein
MSPGAMRLVGADVSGCVNFPVSEFAPIESASTSAGPRGNASMSRDAVSVNMVLDEINVFLNNFQSL